MKKLLILWIILSNVYLIQGQEFAPIGAKWYYTEYFAFSGDIGYLSIESLKDTVIKEIPCRKLGKNNFLGCTGRGFTEFVYQVDSTIFFYDADLDEFQVLFNLKAEKDSVWYIKIMDSNQEIDTLSVYVDSTDFIEINSKNLKMFHVTYTGTYHGDTINHYTSQIIETIGDVSYLFNLYPNWAGACDMNYSDGLRCYEDPEFGFYSTGIADSCTFTYDWVATEGIMSNRYNLIIYPNPTNGQFQIEIDSKETVTIEIINLLGDIIYSKEFVSNTQVDINGYPNALYFACLKYNNVVLKMSKILKY